MRDRWRMERERARTRSEVEELIETRRPIGRCIYVRWKNAFAKDAFSP